VSPAAPCTGGPGPTAAPRNPNKPVRCAPTTNGKDTGANISITLIIFTEYTESVLELVLSAVPKAGGGGEGDIKASSGCAFPFLYQR